MGLVDNSDDPVKDHQFDRGKRLGGVLPNSVVNYLDTSEQLLIEKENFIANAEKTLKETVKVTRYIEGKVKSLMNNAGTMGDTEPTLKDLAKMLGTLQNSANNTNANVEGARKDIKEIRADVETVKNEVKAVCGRVEALETGSQKPSGSKDTTGAADNDVKMTEPGTSKPPITPAKNGPILVKPLSPGAEDTWAKRAAMTTIGTPKLDKLVDSIPSSHPAKSAMPYMKPEVKKVGGKLPSAKAMDNYDTTRCQMVASALELYDEFERESKGRTPVGRGANPSRGAKARMTSLRKIMTGLNIQDPRDRRRKSAIDGDKLPDGRINCWFDMTKLGALNTDLLIGERHFKKQYSGTEGGEKKFE